jgi:hypothetical protein
LRRANGPTPRARQTNAQQLGSAYHSYALPQAGRGRHQIERLAQEAASTTRPRLYAGARRCRGCAFGREVSRPLHHRLAIYCQLMSARSRCLRGQRSARSVDTACALRRDTQPDNRHVAGPLMIQTKKETPGGSVFAAELDREGNRTCAKLGNKTKNETAFELRSTKRRQDPRRHKRRSPNAQEWRRNSARRQNLTSHEIDVARSGLCHRLL